MKVKITYLVLIILFGISNNIFGQSIITDTDKYTTEKLVSEVLISGTIKIENIKYTGSSSSISYFYDGEEGICFSSGILLSTGNAKEAEGPNKKINTSGVMNAKGDKDLESIIKTYRTFDAAILEFDFTPITDSVSFEYIFASEEYPEYANSSYNDVFAFFVSGKNPLGGEYNNVNIAKIPNSETPVSINTINHSKNNNLYIKNSSGKNNEFDGLTVPLIAKIKVVSGETYHIKIAIADVNDNQFDSGVFLKAQSFNGGSSIAYQNTCFGEKTYFQASNKELFDECLWNFGDPDSGKENTSKDFETYHIFTKAGTYEVTLTTYKNGVAKTVKETIEIQGIKINLGLDKVLKNGEVIILDAGVIAKTYLWITGETTKTITVNQAGTYTVTVTFENGCTSTDTIIIKTKDICNRCCWLSIIFAIIISLVSLWLFFYCKKHFCNN